MEFCHSFPKEKFSVPTGNDSSFISAVYLLHIKGLVKLSREGGGRFLSVHFCGYCS